MNEKQKTESRLFLIVSLWLKTEIVSDFEAYESRAARLLEKHGGRIERAVRVRNQKGAANEPFEIHVVSFPNERKFAEYQTDAETLELAASRNDIITRTEIVAGYEASDYHKPEN